MRILVGACVALLPSVAAAVPVAPPPPPPERAIAVTISPLHLLSPIVELTGEYRVGPKLGVAATLGAGSVTAKDGGGTEHRFTVGELGGSARYYVTGSFARGLQVGGELMYLLVELDDPMTTVRATGDGLSVSPFIGYKWTGVGGFTAEAQGGLSVLVAQAHATDGTTSADNEQSRVYPLINLNLGWSF